MAESTAVWRSRQILCGALSMVLILCVGATSIAAKVCNVAVLEAASNVGAAVAAVSFVAVIVFRIKAGATSNGG